MYLSTCYRAVDHNPSSPLKGFAVHVSQVDLANGRSLSAPVVVRKSPSGVAEGSHFIKRGAYYYLFTAEGGTESGHSELVFRSRTGPLGPWEPNPRNPLLSSTLQDDVQNTGHADLVEDLKGNWWAVCLAVRPYRSSTPCENGSAFFPSPLGRETFLMKVHWEHDWPVFNNGQKLALEIESKEPEWRDDFSREELALGWYTKSEDSRLPCLTDLQPLQRARHPAQKGVVTHGAAKPLAPLGRPIQPPVSRKSHDAPAEANQFPWPLVNPS